MAGALAYSAGEASLTDLTPDRDGQIRTHGSAVCGQLHLPGKSLGQIQAHTA